MTAAIATLEPEQMSQTVAPPPTVSVRRRWGLKTVLVLGSAVVVWQVLRVLVGSNFYTVVPGVAYRGAWQSPGDLESLVRSYGVRTVINLRGNCQPLPWYEEQNRTVQRLGINQEDLCFSAARLPSNQELRRLIEVLDEADKPFFIHCRRGSDRTGMACAVLMLLRPNVTFAEARGQLHWRYGHVAMAKTGYLDDFFDLYEQWLQRQQREHSPDSFRHWADKEYRGGWCQYEVEEFTRLTDIVRTGKTAAFKIKVRNTSSHPWHVQPQRKAGFHVAFRVFDRHGTMLIEERAALFERTVNPGESLEAVAILPPRLGPGKYRLQVDLAEENQGWFYQAGSEPLEEELEIRE